jgi:hypothetical protein
LSALSQKMQAARDKRKKRGAAVHAVHGSKVAIERRFRRNAEDQAVSGLTKKPRTVRQVKIRKTGEGATITIAGLDSRGCPEKVVTFKSPIAIKGSLIAERFHAIGKLRDGWCGGLGVAPDKGRLDAVAKKLAGSYPRHLRPPIITLTLDGNLLLEWSASGGLSADIDLGSMAATFHVLGADGKGAAHCFDLGQDGGLGSFLAFLPGRVPKDAGGQAEACAEESSLYAVAAGRLADVKAGRSTSRPIEDIMREYGLEG